MGNEGSKKGGSAPSAPSGSNSVKQHLERAAKSGVLQLQNNGLKEVPAALLQAREMLRNLDLSHNKLPQIPGFIGQFVALKQLHLDHNRLTFLPDELGNLKKLEILSVRENALQSLPDTLVGCLVLKTVYLSSNHFTHFPLAICDLPKLDTVDLSRNKISGLPADSIERLKAMELNLNQNQLSSLPPELAKCARLKVLRVEENCLNKTDFHEAILADSPISLIAFDGNLFQDKDLQQMAGFEQYQERYTATKKKMF
uniref:Leucine-rich repeat-containing protein 57 n=1 Tax=Plectus sambesii TaxID=2011161 RepID=A0A914XRC2_9BILA